MENNEDNMTIGRLESLVLFGDRISGNPGEHRNLMLMNLGPGHAFIHRAWVSIVPGGVGGKAVDLELLGDAVLVPGERMIVLSQEKLSSAADEHVLGQERIGRMLVGTKAETLRIGASTTSSDGTLEIELQGLLVLSEGGIGTVSAKLAKPHRQPPASSSSQMTM